MGLISERIATAILTEETAPGRSFADLKQTLGPHLGYDDYVKIVQQEAEMRRSGIENPYMGDNYFVPRHSSTNEPYGPTDQHNRVIPWSKDDIIEAMKPRVYSIARQFTSGKWQQSGFDVDDAYSNGMMGVLEALDSDEAKTPFPYFAGIYIRKNISAGVGDAKFRKARGLLKDLADMSRPGTTAAHVDALLRGETISVGDRQYNNRRNRLPAINSGEYGDVAPKLTEAGDLLKDAIATNDPKKILAAKKLIEKLSEDVMDYELNSRIGGAKTSDTIRTSSATFKTMQCINCQADLFTDIKGKKRPMRISEVPPDFKCPKCGTTDKPVPKAGTGSIRTKGVTTTQKGSGEEVERADLPAQRELGPAKKAEYKDAAVQLFARAGLTEREQQIIVRLHGLANYPGKDTDADPEIAKSLSGKTRWATPAEEVWAVDPTTGEEIMGYNCDALAKAEIARELGMSEVRVGTLTKAANKKLQAAAATLGMTEDVDYFELRALLEARIYIIDMILETIPMEHSPHILYS